MIATDLALALDPVVLAQRAGVDPDPWQRTVLRSTSSRLLLNCCRQSGKSTTAAALALHGALYEPGTLQLVLSPGQRQSGELFKKVLASYRRLGRPVPADSETALTLALENGSRIVALPGSEGTIRGYSGVRRLIVDEASRVLDDLYHAVRPMLAVSGGQLVAMSTPWGKRGWWYHAWTEGGDGWERVKVTADQCPRITPAFLDEERRSLPPWWHAQEYEGSFEDTTLQVFPTDLVLAAGRDELEPLFGAPSPPITTEGADQDLQPLFGVIT